MWISGVVDKLTSEMVRNVFEGNAGKQFMAAFYKKVSGNIKCYKSDLFKIYCRKTSQSVANRGEARGKINQEAVGFLGQFTAGI